ncbi:MAG: glycoside hydrolase family 5 protein [Erysipelotrichaceae bacterium]|nr:glycoside hydrolase family 5 protein [Erysipelotrichaceae bacterium]
MKKALVIMMCILLFIGCTPKQEGSFDGKDRPSSVGQLQVIDGQLCGEDGEPVMLRGISNYGVSTSHMYNTDETFHDISHFMGCNVIRLALYTYGTGSFGYCTGGDKELLKQDVMDGVEFARNQDMYVIIDWHILDDYDPHQFMDEAISFFDELSARYKDYNNVIYEICNEPHKITWEEIKDYADKVIPVIRSNDPDSVIIVGTPEWSSRVDIAAEAPLEYDNLLYALHFYSASHKQDSRDNVRKAVDKGLPIFVSEFGVTHSSGGFPLDMEEGDRWIDFLEENGISYVMWNFSRTTEPCAVLNRNNLKTHDFTLEDFKDSGIWLINTIRERSEKE